MVRIRGLVTYSWITFDAVRGGHSRGQERNRKNGKEHLTKEWGRSPVIVAAKSRRDGPMRAVEKFRRTLLVRTKRKQLVEKNTTTEAQSKHSNTKEERNCHWPPGR